jgi:RNA polymerase primary sigma factor
LTKITKTFSDLEQKFQREPSTQEVAEVIGLTPEEITDSLRISGRHVSVDAPFSQGEEGSLLDVLSDINESNPESSMMAESLVKEVQRALATLTIREADVISLYFGLNNKHSMTLEEIADKFNLTRERVRQIKEKATRRLRYTSRNKTLKSYLG